MKAHLRVRRYRLLPTRFGSWLRPLTVTMPCEYVAVMRAPSPDHCSLLVPLLQRRDGLETGVELSADRSQTVLNIAWGQDQGESYEHVSTNVSPEVPGASFDFFFTDEVSRVVDPATQEVLWEADGAPVVR